MLYDPEVRSYTVNFGSIDWKFEMTTKVNKVDEGVVLTVSSPHYKELISKYPQLEGVVMEDNDKKSELPIHLILGASEYSRIKTKIKPRISKPSEAIAELTTLGWSMISSGKDTSFPNVYLTKSSAADYEQLCSLDVLGLEDSPESDQGSL